MRSSDKYQVGAPEATNPNRVPRDMRSISSNRKCFSQLPRSLKTPSCFSLQFHVTQTSKKTRPKRGLNEAQTRSRDWGDTILTGTKLNKENPTPMCLAQLGVTPRSKPALSKNTASSPLAKFAQIPMV